MFNIRRGVSRGERDGERGRSRGHNPSDRGSQPPRPLEVRLADLNLGGADGDGARPVHVVTNHFKLRWVGPNGDQRPEDFIIHHYHVDFLSKDTQSHLRRIMILKSKELYNGPYIYDGDSQLFCLNKFTEKPLTIEDPRNAEESADTPSFTFTITYVKSSIPSDPIYQQIGNLVVKKCLFAIGLDRIGQHFYDPRATIDYEAFKLQIWPGYMTSIKLCESGPLLSVDVTHKIVRTVSLLDVIKSLMYAHDKEKSPQPLQDYISARIKGTNFITSYNRRCYTADEVNLAPACDYTFILKKGQEINLLHYFNMRYRVRVDDPKQPTVVSSVKRYKGDGQRELEKVQLLPELCRLTGLTDEMRANMSVMKQLGKHLHLDPNDRVKLLHHFIKRINDSEECQTVLRSWGFVLEPELKDCTIGRVLPNETIVFGDGGTFKADEKGDWTRSLRAVKMCVTVPLQKWAVICGSKDMNKAKEFIRTMQKVAGPLGFNISTPPIIETLPDIRIGGYVRRVEDVVSKHKDGLQLVFCVLPGSSQTNNAELYGGIKKRLTQEHGVISQCVLSKNLYSKNAISIATKIVVQMNTKVGGEPWTVRIPEDLKQGTIVLGFDFYGKGNKVGALVASMNSDASKYYSVLFQYRDGFQLNEKFNEHIGKSLRIYAKENGPPQTVIFYRGNMDDGKVSCGQVEEDARVMQSMVETWGSVLKKKDIQFVYIAFGRRNVTRLMSHTGSCDERFSSEKVVNAFPGTVVDSDIVERKYREFYLVPSVARQGTVRAMHYRVLLDTKQLPLNLLEAYTYKLCHLYYNWTGTVNVPSVCQLAGKLATQASQALGGASPHEKLNENMHYL